MADLILLFQVCPLCAANLGKDVIGHFMVQHASSLKVLVLIFGSYKMYSIYDLNGGNLYLIGDICALQHRRKPQKSGFWTSSTARLGKELSKRGREDSYESAPDPLLSSFVCSMYFAEPKGILQDERSSTGAPAAFDIKRYSPIFCNLQSAKRSIFHIQ